METADGRNKEKNTTNEMTHTDCLKEMNTPRESAVAQIMLDLYSMSM